MPGTRQHRSVMTTKGHGTARNGDDSSTTAANTTHPGPFCVLTCPFTLGWRPEGCPPYCPAPTPHDAREISVTRTERTSVISPVRWLTRPGGRNGSRSRGPSDGADCSSVRGPGGAPQWISVTRSETTRQPVAVDGRLGCRNGSRSQGPRRRGRWSERRGHRGAATDLCREDRDDGAGRTAPMTPRPPQWISVARTETTRHGPARRPWGHAAIDLGREDRDDPLGDALLATVVGAAMDLGREDRDDRRGDADDSRGHRAAMDLGREDRDDPPPGWTVLRLASPQWISVARTETTWLLPGGPPTRSTCRNGSRSRGPRRRPHPRRSLGQHLAAMDLGREDRDDEVYQERAYCPTCAAMDLGREDRDD